MCLEIGEADQLSSFARKKDRIVAVDMHKRYDPDHLRIRDDIRNRIGEPLYGTAFFGGTVGGFDEYLQVVEQSDPVQLCGAALGGFDLSLLQEQTGFPDGCGPEKALKRDESTRMTPCRCGWIMRTA